jgi:hypothetical protein
MSQGSDKKRRLAERSRSAATVRRKKSLKKYREKNEMLLHGIPDRFWVVTKPDESSEMGDICCSATIESLMHRAKCGLRQADIVGIYDDEELALEMAKKLLGEWVVPCEDSVAVEVLVHLMCHPVTAGMTAKAIAHSAVEAVDNAVRHAEEAGYRHRLSGDMRMGVGEVELHNQFALFG